PLFPLAPAPPALSPLSLHDALPIWRVPALSLERDGVPALNGLFLGIVSNSSPWTYLGQRPVLASPRAGFETGLDLLAVRRLGTLRTLNLVRQMLSLGGGPAGRQVVRLHAQP